MDMIRSGLLACDFPTAHNSDAQVKFSEEVQEVISPDLNNLPDTANCYTIFVPEQVKLAIYVTPSIKIFCGSMIDNHLYGM